MPGRLDVPALSRRGLPAGGMLAEAGLRVVGIEGGLVGGELAGASTTTPDWAPVAKRIRDQATDI